MKAQEAAPPRPPELLDRGKRKFRLVRSDKEAPGHAGDTRPPKAVRPGLTSQVESFAKIAGELPPLFERHHRELFDLAHSAPLEPNWELYFHLDASGRLVVTTARYGSVLAGYIINILDRLLFSRSYLYSCIEKFYLDEPYRGEGFAPKWFAFNDEALREKKVRAVMVAEKLNQEKSTGVLFQRMGYKPIETIWMREL